MHFHHVATADGRDGHLLGHRSSATVGCRLLALVEAGGLGPHSHQSADGCGGGLPAVLLEQTAREHEGDDHHRRVEIGVPSQSAAAPEPVAGKGVHHAEDEGDAGAQCHQGVHAGRQVAQLSPGADIELAAAIGQVEQGQQHAGLVGHIARADFQPSHRDGHHQQGHHPRFHHLPAQHRVVAALHLGHAAVGLYHQVVADGTDLALHIVECDEAVVPFHQGGARGQRHRRRDDAIQRP